MKDLDEKQQEELCEKLNKLIENMEGGNDK